MDNENKAQTQTKKGNGKKIAIFAVILVALAAILATVYFVTRPGAQAGAKALTILVDPGDKGAAQTFNVNTDEEFLGPVLVAEGIVKGESSEHGLFITEAGGVTADEANQEWWRISQDGEALATGADTAPIADGDNYELTLTVGY